jgi:hypothetical protein
LGLDGSIRFILATSERQGIDVLLQIPKSMKLDSVKARSSCQIELVSVSPEWIKRAGEQADIDLKFMTRNMRQLLENIDENVKVHNRIQRLKLAWYDPTRKLLFVEGVRQAVAPIRYAINDMARCPEWVASNSTVWFSAPIDQLFTQNFSLWEEGILTGQWLRSTMWHDEKRLWAAMNSNWKSLLGDRLQRPNEAHPFSSQYKEQSQRIVTLQDEMVRLRRLASKDTDSGDRAREVMVRGGTILLALHRKVISALLAYGDVAEEWHTFFPAFEFSINTARRYTVDGSAGSAKTGVKAKAAHAFESVVQWLAGEDGDQVEPDKAEDNDDEDDDPTPLALLETRDREPATSTPQRPLPLMAASRPLTHRLAQLHADEQSPTDDTPPTRIRKVAQPSLSTEMDDNAITERTKIGLGLITRPPMVAPSMDGPPRDKLLGPTVKAGRRPPSPLSPSSSSPMSPLSPLTPLSPLSPMSPLTPQSPQSPGARKTAQVADDLSDLEDLEDLSDLDLDELDQDLDRSADRPEEE